MGVRLSYLVIDGSTNRKSFRIARQGVFVVSKSLLRISHIVPNIRLPAKVAIRLRQFQSALKIGERLVVFPELAKRKANVATCDSFALCVACRLSQGQYILV